MSVILGLNAVHAGASAALLVDGQPVAAIAEERLNRVKYYARFPALAIRKCLDMAGLEFRDIDAVALGRDPRANRGRKIAYALRHPTGVANFIGQKSRRRALDNLRDLMARECGAKLSDLRFTQHNIEHHLAHTASAYFCSGWDRAAGFTLDEAGDFVTCMMSECVGDEIRVVRRIHVPQSLGTLYTMICEFIGYDRFGDEGKVMGLAPLGRDTYHDFFERLATLHDRGVTLNPEFFVPFSRRPGLKIDDEGQIELYRYYSQRMCHVFGEPRRRGATITQRDTDLAFGVQRLLEKCYLHLLNTLSALVPCERLVMAGGCILNSVANGKVFDHTPFRATWIQPAAGDDGLALGAALYVSRAVLKEGRPYRMTNAFLGPEYSESEIKQELERAGVNFVRCDRHVLLDETAGEIARGSVVGWFQGRMEWGPRALGNRSILAHPGRPDMKDVLNARIKHRESFRPFAPSVLQDRQGELFEHDFPSPFMLHVYKIRPEWRQRLCAVNHVDDTGRLQSVSREENPLYYDLISRFEQKTGIPVILNTSFNENEPVVCRPAEAIDCFMRTRMDVLVIGPFVCRKPARSRAIAGAAQGVTATSGAASFA